MLKNKKNNLKKLFIDTKQDPEVSKFFLEPIPWLILGFIVSIIILLALEVIEYFG